MCLRFPWFREVSLIFQDYRSAQTTCFFTTLIVLDSFSTTFPYSQKTLLRIDILREVEAITPVILKGLVK